jgi:RimJ/RimL family protein N-acetyltransferase
MALNTVELPTRIETARLILRPYRLEDSGWYFHMSQLNKPHLTIFESGNAVNGIYSEADAQKVMGDFISLWEARKAFFLGAFLKDSDDFVAQVYIGVVNRDLPEFEIGYFADVDHEGRGYVTEAVKCAMGFLFNELGAHRLRLECDESNVRSVAVAERCGFVREGHIHENKRKADGSFSGDLQYGILRSEFFSSP